MKLKSKTYGSKGPRCILLHGFGADGYVFAPFIEYLEQYFQVTLLDLPGYGINYDYALNSRDPKTLLKLLKISVDKPALWIGWSMGGMLALQLAIEDPELVTGVVSVGSNVKFTNSNTWAHGMPAEVFQGFAKDLQENYTTTFKQFLQLACHGNLDSLRVLTKLVKQQSPLIPTAETLSRDLLWLQNADLRSDLNIINCPILKIFGDKDKLVPISAAEQIKLLHPDITIEIIEKSGHAPFLSHPAQVAQTISYFHQTRLSKKNHE